MSVAILNGDCRLIVPTLGLASFDLILTDPPYGETSLTWDRWVDGWPALVRPLVKRTGSMWCFGSTRMFMDHAAEFRDAGWRIIQDVVWEKHNGSGFIADRFKRVHETAVQFAPVGVPWAETYKAPQFTFDSPAKRVTRRGRTVHTGDIKQSAYSRDAGGPRLMRSVLQVRSCHGHAEHPTQKPEGIVEPLMAYACPSGGTVLDPFAGSGTTGLVARRTSRNAVLVEADPTFAATIASRLDNDAPLLMRDVA